MRDSDKIARRNGGDTLCEDCCLIGPPGAASAAAVSKSTVTRIE